MTLDRFKRYFTLTEIVSRDVAAKYGERAWGFFDPRLLEVVLWIRETLGIPIVINTRQLQQRGLRENTCQIVRDKTKAGKTYLSAHVLGKGVDFSSGVMSAVEIRRWIRSHIDECPYPIRLEGDKSAPTWVHIDVCNVGTKKLIEFEA